MRRWGQCKYAPIIAPDGGIVNDPILLRLGENHFWLSLADSDTLLYAGVQAFAGLDVQLREPDVSPLQVQGPSSPDVMRALFGDDVMALRYYRCCESYGRDHPSGRFPHRVDRRGRLRDLPAGRVARRGAVGRVMTAGGPFDIKATAPSDQRRMEAGIFNYGNDFTVEDNPFQVSGLERLVESSTPSDHIGKEALAAPATKESPQAGRGRDRGRAALDVARGLLGRCAAAREATSSGTPAPRGRSASRKNIGLRVGADRARGGPGTGLTLESPDGPIPRGHRVPPVPGSGETRPPRGDRAR